MKPFWMGALGGLLPALILIPFLLQADTTAINSVAGGRVQTSHVNQYFNALKLNVVPRNSSGIATTLGGGLGTSSLIWAESWLDKLNVTTSITTGTTLAVGTSATVGTTLGVNGVTLSQNTAANQNGLVSSGGANGLFFPNTTGVAALDGSFGTRTLGVRTSGTTSRFPIVVSAIPSAHGLMIVRGSFQSVPSGVSCGTQRSGEGFSCSRSGTGVLDFTFNNAFADNPVCTCNTWGTTGICTINTDTTSTMRTFSFNTAGALSDNPISFICIGQRGT